MLHTQITHSDAREDEIDLHYYWALVRRFQWQILSLATLITLIAALIAFSLTPIYKASSRVLIEANQAKAVSVQEVVGVDTRQRGYFNTQFQILKSREVAAKVVEKLDLINNRNFYDPEKKHFSFG